MNKKIFLTNVSFAFIAQIISLLSSFIIQFFAPKILGVTSFGYWQLFVFYASYVNISRLGIIDGMYLRNGGRTREQLDKDLIKTELVLFMLFQVFVSAALFVVVRGTVTDPNRLYVLVACLVCLPFINYNNFLGFVFQAINETKLYSVSEAIYNLLWFFGLGALFLGRHKGYEILVVFYIVGQILAGVYLTFKARFLFKGKFCNVKRAVRNMFEEMKVGIFLLFSMYASMLITGSTRFIVDGKWGIESFSYFSFALSWATFILKFMSQISMVLFPALRTLGSESQKSLFVSINSLMGILLPAFLILFAPIRLFVSWWLPQYQSSMIYLAILLPMCVFDGKMQLVYSTYFKVLQKGNWLLYANLLAAAISFLFSFVCAYSFDSMLGIALSLLIAIIVSSLASELVLSHFMTVKCSRLLNLSKLILSAAFIAANLLLQEIPALILYVLFYLAFVLINRRSLVDSWRSLKKVIN